MITPNIRSNFPVFNKDPNLVFFDSAASALKVDKMIKAVNNCYSYEYANVHRGIYKLSSDLTKKFEDSRIKVANFVNTKSHNNIIFTKSATEGINLVASCLASKHFKENDEIILSYLEHHANIVPWHLVQKTKKINIVPVNLNSFGEIDYNDLKNKINSKTKLISLTHMSNVTGALTDINKVLDLKKRFNIPLLLDGCQFVPHNKLNLKEIDPDFYVFSAHKLYGPSGLGILYMKDKWIESFAPYQGGGSMIKDVNILNSSYASGFEKFEAGTPPIAQVIGLSASIEFLSEIGMNNLYTHELELYSYALERLKEINKLEIYGLSKNNDAIISFNIKGYHFNDLALLLDKKNIAIRSGHHCAQPLMKYLNITGTARMSFGIYNTKEEIDYFIDNLKSIIKILD